MRKVGSSLWFNGIPTTVGYLIPKLSLKKNNNGTILATCLMGTLPPIQTGPDVWDV